jgi:2-C-methyl-D-erythritol 4-phosphate cytidylyltransferase
VNYALIFAGGVGRRMSSSAKPKQFLELHGKPIIVYTLEAFENCEAVDGIAVVCIKSYIDELNKFIRRHELKKTVAIVPGDDSGFGSICNGLSALDGICSRDDIVLIHDGVRPFIDSRVIAENISCAKQYGNAITAIPVTEGVSVSEDGFTVDEFMNRNLVYTTRAPQTFRYGEIFDLYKRAQSENFEAIESAHLCSHYGIKLHMVMGSPNNIKITTPTDYYIFKAIYEAIENSQIVGY